MRLKKNKNNKSERITFRSTIDDSHKIQQKANIYTDGNISEYVLFASLNFVPSKDDFEEEKSLKPKRKKWKL